MRLSTVVAVVLLASSATGAEPRDGGRPASVPDERVEQRGDRWVTLATAVPTRHGIESIAIGRPAGAFRSLRIDALSGTVHVRSIRIEFSNGRMATFYLPRRLDRRHAHAYVDLIAPRFIDNIVITTARWPAGTYALFGAQGAPAGHDLIAGN